MAYGYKCIYFALLCGLKQVIAFESVPEER